ncbi:MAG: hypothetical protein HQ593_02080 [Candidatus Omnitrophica bacterium]|nr:hypothetical protein [Candidatus Omnitrophota bacterium]
MKKIKWVGSAALAIALVLFFSSASFADDTDALLKLLVEKGLITENESRTVKAEVKEEKGFLSKKGVKVEISGATEVEIVDVQEDHTTLDSVTTSTADRTNQFERPHLQVDKVTLRATVTSVDETIGFSSELEFDEAETAFFDDAYIFLKDVEIYETKHFVKAGLMSRWIEPKRVFESYPIAGIPYWEDEELQIIYGGEWEWLYWRLSASNGLNLDDKGATEGGATFEILHDDRSSDSDEIPTELGSIEWGAGAGVELDTDDFGKINIMGFYLGQKMQDADYAKLNAIANYVSNTEDEQFRAGVNVDYKFENFGVRGQYIASTDAKLDRWAAHIEPYYTFKLDYRYLKGLTPAVQLSWYDVDLKKDAISATDARSWDRQKYTFGLIAKINKNLKWKNEYSVNDEDTGAGDVDNDEFISQLQFKF